MCALILVGIMPRDVRQKRNAHLIVDGESVALDRSAGAVADNSILASIERLVYQAVDQAVDKKLPEMVAVRVAGELSRRPGADTAVVALLVERGDVYLTIKAAVAVADCHP
jgi:hypothetical protein